jgi:hypothetical protein
MLTFHFLIKSKKTRLSTVEKQNTKEKIMDSNDCLSENKKLNLLSQALESEDPAIQLAVDSLCTLMLLSGTDSSKRGKLLTQIIQLEIVYFRFHGPL